jgi:hypothetical protein
VSASVDTSHFNTLPSMYIGKHTSTPGPLLLMLILCNAHHQFATHHCFPIQRVLYYVNMQIEFVTSPHMDDSACGLCTSNNEIRTARRLARIQHATTEATLHVVHCLRDCATSGFWNAPVYGQLFFIFTFS